MLDYEIVYRNEVKRCDMFLTSLEAYIAANGETCELAHLREHWKTERAIWTFGLNEWQKESGKA